MIRPACPADRPALEKLYRSCFSESAAYTALAFDHLFCRADILVFAADGAPRSMCFLLPFLFRHGRCAVRAQYLYAACTEEAYRGQGLMNEILLAADSWCRDADRAFTFLVPASESLFSYSGAHGYDAVFERAKVSPGVPQGMAGETPGLSVLRRLRQQYLETDGCLVQSGWSMAFIAADAAAAGGVLRGMQLPHGMGYAVQYGSVVKELCCDREDLSAAAGLLKKTGAQTIYSSPFLSDGERVPYAMAKTPDGTPPLFREGYCNLLFD